MDISEEFDNVGQANFNSLQLSLTRRFSSSKMGDLQYQASYTHSRSIDNESGFRSGNGTVPAINFDQFKSVSNFNVPNYFALSGTWELPFDKLWDSGPKRFTKGWTLYPIVSYQSGTPLDITARLSTSPTKPGPSGLGDSSLVRANLVSPIVYYSPETNQAISGRTGNYYFQSDGIFDSWSFVDQCPYKSWRRNLWNSGPECLPGTSASDQREHRNR